MSAATDTPRHVRFVVFGSIAAVLAIVAIIAWWVVSASHPSTDDAKLDAHTVHIAAQLSGRVAKLHVAPNQFVRAGTPLFDLETDRPIEEVRKAEAALVLVRHQIEADNSAVAAARAMVGEQGADFDLAQQRLDRMMPLVEKKVLDQLTGVQVASTFMRARSLLDEAKFRLAEAESEMGSPAAQNALIESAEAALALARINLGYTTLLAPADGFVTDFDLRVGEMVLPGQPLFPFVESETWWAQANFKETQVASIRPGQRARVTVDMYPGKSFTGVVESLSAGSAAAFSLLPPQNTTGNYVKVTQRIPVRIRLDPAPPETPFRLGASCEVTVDVTSAP